MRLISLDQYPDYKPDVEFRSPSSDRLVAAVVCGALSAAAIVAPRIAFPSMHGGRLPGWWCYPVGTLFGILFLAHLAALRKSRHGTNWLLRSSGTRQWIKFRTFLNDHLPTGDLQIIELERSEVAWVQPVRVRAVYHTRNGSETGGWIDTHQRMRFLDIGLRHGDTEALDAQLRIEEQHEGAGRLGVRHKSNNYPVSVPEPGVVRLVWSDQYGRISPGIDAAIGFFNHWTEVRPAEDLRLDYRPRAVLGLPEDQRRLRLRELKRIDSMSASHVAAEMNKSSRDRI